MLHRPIGEQQKPADHADAGIGLQPLDHQVEEIAPLGEDVGIEEADVAAARMLQAEIAGGAEAAIFRGQDHAERNAEAAEGGMGQRQQRVLLPRFVEDIDDLIRLQPAPAEHRQLVAQEIEPPVERDQKAEARRGRRRAEGDLLGLRGTGQAAAIEAQHRRAQHGLEDAGDVVRRDRAHAQDAADGGQPGSHRARQGLEGDPAIDKPDFQEARIPRRAPRIAIGDEAGARVGDPVARAEGLDDVVARDPDLRRGERRRCRGPAAEVEGGDLLLRIQPPADQHRGARPDLHDIVHLDMHGQAERGERVVPRVDRPPEQGGERRGLVPQGQPRRVAGRLQGVLLRARFEPGGGDDAKLAPVQPGAEEPQARGGFATRHDTRQEHDIAHADIRDVAPLMQQDQGFRGLSIMLEHRGHHDLGVQPVLMLHPAAQHQAAKACGYGEVVDIAMRLLRLGRAARDRRLGDLRGRDEEFGGGGGLRGIAQGDGWRELQPRRAQHDEAILDLQRRRARDPQGDALVGEGHADREPSRQPAGRDVEPAFLAPLLALTIVHDQPVGLGAHDEVQGDRLAQEEIDAVPVGAGDRGEEEM